MIKGEFRIKMSGGFFSYQSAKSIYKMLKEEKKMPFSIISLVDTCCDRRFPEEYSKKIKLFLLEYFTKGFLPEEYKNAIFKCYNSLLYTDKETVKVKRRFLFNLIETESSSQNIKSDELKGWMIKKFEENKMKAQLDFKNFLKELNYELYVNFKKK